MSKMHFQRFLKELGLFEVVEPDFLSYDFAFLKENRNLSKRLKTERENRKLPLLVWAIRNVEEKAMADGLEGYDNYIVDGAKFY